MLKKFNSQKGIIHLLLIVILLVGIIAGVFLVQKTQIFKPKAYSVSNFTLTDSSGIKLPESISDPNVNLLLALPEHWDLSGSEGPVTKSFIKKAYAQDNSCPTEGKGTTNPCYSNLTTYDTCIDDNGGTNTKGTLCQTGGSSFYCYYSANEACISGKDKNDFNYSCNICQSVPSPRPTPPPSFEPSPISVPSTNTSSIKTSLSVNSFCAGPHGIYNEPHLDVNINTIVEGTIAQNNYILTTVTDTLTGVVGNLSLGFGGNIKLHGSFQIFRDAIGIEPSSVEFKFIPDGRTYMVNTYLASYYNKPNLSDPLSTESFSSFCESYPTFTPPNVTLKEMIIENVDTDQSSGGSEPLHITSNFRNYLNKPFAWKLNNLKLDQTEAERAVKVRFVSDDGNSWYENIETITLKYKTISADATLAVDVVLDKDWENLMEMEDWAKDTVNNYINNKLKESNINRKVQFNNLYIDDLPNCHDYSELFNTVKNNITIFIPKEGNFPVVGWAKPYEKIICYGGVDIQGINSKQVLLHELGHIFGLPDYYLQDVRDNQVVYNLRIEPVIKDVMWYVYYSDSFSTNSREIINRLSNPLPQDSNFWKYYSPKQVILQVLDNGGLPLPAVKIEIFPAIWDWTEGSEYVHRFIPNNSSLTLVTDNTGRVFLGDQANIFNHKKYPSAGTTGVALVRITSKGDVRYGALSMSYLNSLFFAQDQNATATILAPFSQLVQANSDYSSKIIKPFSQSEVATSSATVLNKDSSAEKHLYMELKVNGELDKHKVSP